MVLGLQVFESEQDVCTQTLQADNLQTATEVLRVCLAHGKSKAIAVQSETSGNTYNFESLCQPGTSMFSFTARYDIKLPG